MVGITPEAPTHEAAFQGREPEQIVDIYPDDLRRERKSLSTAEGEKLDIVVLGSPHFSAEEFKRLVPLVIGKQCHPDVEFLITSSRAMYSKIEKTGLVQSLRDFGVRISVDTCILNMPMLKPKMRILMTNSAKYAHYVPGRLGLEVVFGSMADCVQSAIEGRVSRKEDLWNRT